MRRSSAVAAGLLAFTIALAACAGQPASPASPSVPSEAAPALDHVHGLAEHPRTGELLVASHNGIFTLTASGEVTGPVGMHVFDAMGFTVAGDVLFASGHPGPDTPAELGSPHLGIIRSDDHGESWTPVAMNGTTDFHVLTADADGVLYGIPTDRTTLLISADDGLSWTTAADLATVDLAATGSGLYAATEQGLQRSDDGGRTFTTVDGAPLLYSVAARADGTLIGAGVDNALWEGREGTWTRGETVEGPVQALAALDDRVVFVDDRGIVELAAEGLRVLSPMAG